MTADPSRKVIVVCVSVIGGAALLQCVRSIVATGLPCVIVADPRAITPDISDIFSNNSLEFIDGAIPADVFVPILSRKH
jgi:hypothetical protein